MNDHETDAIFAATQHRQVQCPRCHTLVLLNQWTSTFDICAACVRDLFSLEMQEDGSYKLTPEREARRSSRMEQEITQSRSPKIHQRFPDASG